MIKEMLKVQIIGPRVLLDDVIRFLHTAGVVHIETAPGERTEDGEPIGRLPLEAEKLKDKEALEGYALRLKGLKALLRQPPSWTPERVDTQAIAGRMEDLSPIEERARALRQRKDELAGELAVMDKYEKLLRGFAPIVTRLGGLKNFEITGLTLERTREDIAGLLEAEVARVTEGVYSIHVKDVDEHTIGVVLTYKKAFAQRVRSLLSGKAISEMRLPDEYSEMTLTEALIKMGRRKAEIPGLIEDIDGELYTISVIWYPVAAGLARAVEEALDEIGVLAYASATRFAFIIEGWVPADSYGALSSGLSEGFNGRVYMRTRATSREEMPAVPVYIKNPAPLRPFEIFLLAVPAPRYGSIDPTPFVAVFFPIFFGLIVADMGYGGAIFAISLYLRRRLAGRRFYKDVATVLMVSAASAVFFGFLFGELFGDLGERAGLVHPILVNRIDALKALMAVALAIGVGHVLLGVCISVVNHASRHEARKTVGKVAYLVLILSSLAMLGALFGLLGRAVVPWAGLSMAVSFVVMTAIEGVLGPIGLVEAFGSIVSYIRIMAVGTASVVMALVANRIGAMSESLAVGVIVATLIHALNLLLSLLSPSIQSMRLQYVEFFGKFYEGGGRPYRPFRKR